MEIACLDLEGVLVPEIWIEFAEKTGIEALKASVVSLAPDPQAQASTSAKAAGGGKRQPKKNAGCTL